MAEIYARKIVVPKTTISPRFVHKKASKSHVFAPSNLPNPLKNSASPHAKKYYL
jgi:hypothetical protein